MNAIGRLVWIVGVALLLVQCSSVSESKNVWFRDINVCKKLVGDVLVYPVFVQEKKGEPWKDQDRKEYLDSLNVALNWIMHQAAEDTVKLNFTTVAHPKVIKKGLPAKTVRESIDMLKNTKSYLKFNKHYNGLSKMVVKGIAKEQVLQPLVTKIKNKERLIALLRNTYQVESVVLLFVHKPQALDHIYLTLNSLTNKDVEFVVTTFRSPTVLGYQVLELFGAAPMMYRSGNKKEVASKEFVQQNYPNDIMANLNKSIQQLSMSEYTRYLVGWNTDFKEQYKILVSQRKVMIK